MQGKPAAEVEIQDTRPRVPSSPRDAEEQTYDKFDFMELHANGEPERFATEPTKET